MTDQQHIEQRRLDDAHLASQFEQAAGHDTSERGVLREATLADDTVKDEPPVSEAELRAEGIALRTGCELNDKVAIVDRIMSSNEHPLQDTVCANDADVVLPRLSKHEYAHLKGKSELGTLSEYDLAKIKRATSQELQPQQAVARPQAQTSSYVAEAQRADAEQARWAKDRSARETAHRQASYPAVAAAQLQSAGYEQWLASAMQFAPEDYIRHAVELEARISSGETWDAEEIKDLASKAQSLRSTALHVNERVNQVANRTAFMHDADRVIAANPDLRDVNSPKGRAMLEVFAQFPELADIPNGASRAFEVVNSMVSLTQDRGKLGHEHRR